MGKLAFVFPGQGAQYVGMGKEFYEQISVSRKVYTIASEVTGLNLPGLCFEKNEQIDITEYTQIAMLTTEAAILAALQETRITACLGMRKRHRQNGIRTTRLCMDRMIMSASIRPWMSMEKSMH